MTQCSLKTGLDKIMKGGENEMTFYQWIYKYKGIYAWDACTCDEVDEIYTRHSDEYVQYCEDNNMEPDYWT